MSSTADALDLSGLTKAKKQAHHEKYETFMGRTPTAPPPKSEAESRLKKGDKYAEAGRRSRRRHGGRGKKTHRRGGRKSLGRRR